MDKKRTTENFKITLEGKVTRRHRTTPKTGSWESLATTLRQRRAPCPSTEMLLSSFGYSQYEDDMSFFLRLS
jgi:hypothetical protein